MNKDFRISNLCVFAILLVVLAHSIIIFNPSWNYYSLKYNSSFFSNVMRCNLYFSYAFIFFYIWFFIHGFSSVFLEKKLFDDLPEAWIHGPVYKEIYNCFAYYKNNKISYEDLLKNREYNLTEEEKKYLDILIEDFGCYSGSLLREMTHITSPWINARKNLDSKCYSNRIIEQKDIDDYFKEICTKYNINNVEDIVKYSNDMFKKTRGIFIKD